VYVVVLTMAVGNNCGGGRSRRRKHWVHPHIAEKVSTYGTFAASRDLSKYPDKFKGMYRMSKESFRELCEYVRPFISKKDTNCRNAIPVEERLLILIRSRMAATLLLACDRDTVDLVAPHVANKLRRCACRVAVASLWSRLSV
jgi:hypothetical protein